MVQAINENSDLKEASGLNVAVYGVGQPTGSPPNVPFVSMNQINRHSE